MNQVNIRCHFGVDLLFHVRYYYFAISKEGK